jgi:hypothetical protein
VSGLFGWWRWSHASEPSIVPVMAATLRVHPLQQATFHDIGPLRVGHLSRAAGLADDQGTVLHTADERSELLIVGDVYALRAPLVDADPRGDALLWLRQVMRELRARGVEALCSLDGDYQLVYWDADARTATIASDRFCSWPMYWAAPRAGAAFACGVRGVLAAPGVERDPDIDAIREAVSFGGYRLGDRTNIRAVKMLSVGTALTLRDGAATTQRYWDWRAGATTPAAASSPDAIAEVSSLWRRAIRRRRLSIGRCGQTLSGGRDSRAILGEATRDRSAWTAITYGLPGSDDVRFAERAAQAAGTEWLFSPLYRRGDLDWLETRTRQVQDSDGLIELIDLMHLEPLDQIVRSVDELFVGTYGDFVCGTTYAHVDSSDAALAAMPFSGAPIAFDGVEAAARLLSASAAGTTADPFVVVEHKYPQALSRPSAAVAAWLPVRRPFLDLDLVEFCARQGAPARHILYERWLRASYPQVFARTPIQKTGAPVGAGPARKNLARAERVMRRAARHLAVTMGRRVEPWSRTYTADEEQCAAPEIRPRLEATILRPDSIACEVWGRDTIVSLLERWLDRRQGPAQVIGALYVWEAYHRDLASHLSQANRQVKQQWTS